MQLSAFADFHPLDDVLQKILAEAQLLTASRTAFLHVPEAGEKSVTLQSGTTVSRDDCSAAGEDCFSLPEDAGVWRDCFNQCRPVVYNDCQPPAHGQDVPPGHLSSMRQLVVPVVRDGLITSLIGVGNKESSYDHRDVEALSTFAGIAWDIVARKRAEEALWESKRRLESIFLAVPVGIGMTINRIIVDANDALCSLTGYARQELVGKSARMLYPDDAEYEYVGREKYRQIEEQGIGTIETRWLRKDGTLRNVSLRSSPLHRYDSAKGVTFTVLDISERVRREEYRAMSREVMRILNQPGEVQCLIRQVVAAVKRRINLDSVGIRLQHQDEQKFDAVGIRLQDGEDFPYFAQEGFSENFLLTENSLIERAADGGVCRDEEGNISLECTCGLVLSGKTDPDNPFFTAGGSCWTNNSFPVLDLPAEEDPRHNPRNQCIHQGYASVALVPIRGNGRIIGLLQFNDRRQGQFTSDSIEQLEEIAAHIGTALMRLSAEKSLREERQRLSAILTSSNVGTWEWNIQTGHIIVNARWAEIIGYSLAEILPITVETREKCIHPDDLISCKALLEKHFKGDLDYFEHETRMRHKNGNWVWVLDRGKITSWSADGVPLLMQGTHADISYRKLAEQEQRAALAEKEVLLREVHHRVKNNLAAIIGLLNLQREKIVDELAVASFQDLADRVLSMALVHERLYRSDNISRIALQEYLGDLISHLLPAYGVQSQVICHADAHGIEVGLDLAIPLGLLINELVTNALKYAFPAGRSGTGAGCAEIMIRVTEEGRDYTLTVADNGIGLPTGFDWRACPSLGLYLVRMLGEHQLGGEIELDQAEGVRFVLRFKNRLKAAR